MIITATSEYFDKLYFIKVVINPIPVFFRVNKKNIGKFDYILTICCYIAILSHVHFGPNLVIKTAIFRISRARACQTTVYVIDYNSAYQQLNSTEFRDKSQNSKPNKMCLYLITWRCFNIKTNKLF